MTSDAVAFFEELGSRGHEPMLAKARGTARFEIVEGARTLRWLVAVDKGELRVSRRSAAADCVLRVDKRVFDRAVTGELNFMAAVLRGEVAVRGDPRLLVLLQRLFPRPSRKVKRQRVGSARSEK